MHDLHLTQERSGPLISLTDQAVIATQVRWLQDQGYTELAVWRHFLEHFAVDLDALALIITKLFGPMPACEAPQIAALEAMPQIHQAA
jgi:hypothetical protein